MKFTSIVFALMVCVPALADETANDIALKAGSRQALVCFRQAETLSSYQADRLHLFAPCIQNSDFGDETTPAEHIQFDMRHAAAYYLAVENFGHMTQRDYGTFGASNMLYIAGIGKIALGDLEARGVWIGAGLRASILDRMPPV